jgi:hypothetical protein
MGEHADDLLDAFLDGESFYFHRPITLPHCFRCNTTCYWAKRKGKWRLFESGVAHRCKTTGVKPDDFPSS